MKILCVLLPHFQISCEKLKHPDPVGAPGNHHRCCGFAEGVDGLLAEPERSATGNAAAAGFSFWHGEAELITPDVPLLPVGF